MKEVDRSTQPQVLLRVLITDHRALVNDTLTAFLSEIEGISVFGCVQEISKSLALAEALHPDVMILDLQGTRPFIRETLKSLKSLRPSPVLIVLSDYDEAPLRKAVKLGGADHFLMKTDFEDLVGILNGILRGKE